MSKRTKQLDLVYMGVDPGIKGGVAIIAGRVVEAWRYPKDIPSMTVLLREIISDYDGIQLAAIELVHAVPIWGKSSTFKLGTNYGAFMGALSAFQIPYIIVSPRKWQKAMLDSGTGETKERSLNMARRLFPKIDMRYKADDGKADALHLARWAKMEDER